MGDATSTNNQWALQLAPANGGVGFHHQDNRNADNNIQLAGGTVTSGTWYHVAVSTQPAARTGLQLIRLYLNGAQVDEITTKPVASMPHSPVYLGRGIAYADHSNLFSGLVDDVRVYSWGMNDAEVAALAGKSPMDGGGGAVGNTGGGSMGGAGPVGTGGASSSSAGRAGSGTGGLSTASGGGGASGAAGEMARAASSGCSCRIGGMRPPRASAGWLVLLLSALFRRRGLRRNGRREVAAARG